MSEQQSEPKQAGGWFKVWKSDLQIIHEEYAGRESEATARAVYVALCQLENERGRPFEAKISHVARRGGVGYRTAFTRLHDLERLGIITITRQAKGLDLPHQYALVRSVITSQRSANITERYASERAVHLQTSVKTEKDIKEPPPPQAGAFSSFIDRFRSIERTEFQSPRITDAAIMAVMQNYDATIIESALADLERDAPGDTRERLNPLKMLAAYLSTAHKQATAPKPTRKGKRPAAKVKALQETIKVKVVSYE